MLEKIPTEVIGRAAKVRLLICDVDGVLTNGQLFLRQPGMNSRAFMPEMVMASSLYSGQASKQQ